jgi:succinyl-diaminopimelate desuccinylase
MQGTILKHVDALKNDLIKSIYAITAVPSVKSSATRLYPFGENIAAALDKALAIAASLGFKTYNGGYYYGFAEAAAENNEERDYIGIFGHLDVVAAGKGWQTDPFSPVMKNNTIYARGVLDNKAPLFAALYALKALVNAGVTFKKPVRIVFGCDEESGFADMEYYLKHEEPPLCGFTPDCKYPVVYAERGRLKLQTTAGPEFLSDFYAYITDYFLQADTSGDRLGIACGDAEFHALEMRDYRLSSNHSGISVFAWQVSYPPSVTADQIVAKIRKTLPASLTLQVLKNYNPVFFDKESELVTKLSEAFAAVTGLDSTPVTTTGGTYAKIVPHIVPFGPSFAGQKGIAHNPDEYMTVEDIMTNAAIYALAVYNLTR